MAADDSRTKAKSKIEKARRFLLGATLLNDMALEDLVTSLAVSSAINSSDAIQLMHTRSVTTGQDHGQAVLVLRRLGEVEAAKHLARVLRFKNGSQYGYDRPKPSIADEALKHAERILSVAEKIALENEVLP